MLLTTHISKGQCQSPRCGKNAISQSDCSHIHAMVMLLNQMLQ